MQRNTEQTGRDAGEQIDQQKGEAPKDIFRHPAQVPQTPHVGGDMEQATMKKCGGEQPPWLRGQSFSSVIGSPTYEMLSIWIERGTAGERHGNIDQHINANKRPGDRKCRRWARRLLLRASFRSSGQNLLPALRTELLCFSKGIRRQRTAAVNTGWHQASPISD